MTRFYSHRQGAARGERQPLNKGFWFAFMSSLDELAAKNMFCEFFGSECCDGLPCGWYAPRVQELLQANFGRFDWPISREDEPAETTIFDLIEFFFKYCSEPKESRHHSYCGNDHPESYDQGKGRYAYTVRVNELFHRFHQPFKLVKGQVVKQNSTVLDENLVHAEIELPVDDNHLKSLISRALEHFYSTNGNHKMDGLCGIVDAYERLKTIDKPQDKKQSIEIMTKRIALEQSMIPHLDALFRELTSISNKNTIRHHEYDKHVIDDEATIEFLFYAYYNAIRLMLSC